MDTTETYIKMCEEAKEIQGVFQAKGMFETDNTDFVAGWNVASDYGDYIWLPRQDELQAMFLSHKNPEWSESPTPFELNLLFVDFVQDTLYTDRLCMDIKDSMEQLWLAFLLAEKYGKYWDGAEWVLKK